MSSVVVCAIVSVHNEANTIENVLRQLHRAKIARCVIVLNGCTDDSYIRATSVRHLQYPLLCVHVSDPLGPDVPRAFGTLAGLRRWPEITHYVYVDGDFGGSFGPMLDAFLTKAISENCDVLWSGRSKRAYDFKQRPDLQVWNQLKKQLPRHLVNVDPAVLPTVIRKHVFQVLSPYWLHQPAIWFARVILHTPSFRVGAEETTDVQLLGNRVRSMAHDRTMQQWLYVDAIEAACLLTGRKFIRTDEYTNNFTDRNKRRVDLLKSFMACCSNHHPV